MRSAAAAMVVVASGYARLVAYAKGTHPETHLLRVQAAFRQEQT